MIIYKSINMSSGKVYVGQTSLSLSNRKSKHKKDAKSENTNSMFHRAIRKYGFESFEWEVIDTAITKEELDDKEKYWIDFYNSYIYCDNPNGYNMTIGGDGGATSGSGENHVNFGKELSEEHKRKISETRIASNLSKGESNPMYGKTHTKETRNKMSEAKIAKGSSNGENNGRAKLMEDDVMNIHRLYATKQYTQKELAKMFGIGKSSVGYILSGKNWSYVKEKFEREVR